MSSRWDASGTRACTTASQNSPGHRSDSCAATSADDRVRGRALRRDARRCRRCRRGRGPRRRGACCARARRCRRTRREGGMPGSSRSSHPCAPTRSGGRCSARAQCIVFRRGSTRAHTIVAQNASGIDATCALIASSSAPGSDSDDARTWNAVRRRPMVAAAVMPWPTTSPITNSIRWSGRTTVSYQSPPTAAPFATGGSEQR